MAWKIVLLLQGTLAVRDFLSPPYMIQPIPTTGPIYFENSVEEKTSPPECTAIEQQKIRQCADPLYAIGAITDEGDILSFSWNHFVSRTQDYFGQVCDNFYVFDMCIDPYKELCFSKDPVRERYQTAISVLDFLCRDGYTEMVRNFECFTQTLTRAEMMQCQAELIADTRKIPPEVEVGHTGQQAAVCGAVRNYIDCVKYPIRYECGYRAWYLVKEIIVRPTATLLPQCDVTSIGVVERAYTITIIMILIGCFL